MEDAFNKALGAAVAHSGVTGVVAADAKGLCLGGASDIAVPIDDDCK